MTTANEDSADWAQNEDRADWAQIALDAFRAKVRCDDNQECMSDLLIDLMHLADRHGFNFGQMLEMARESYETEVNEDGGQVRMLPRPESLN